MEILTRVHAENLVRWAEKRKETVVLSADLTSSTEIDLFRERFPERFFSMGIAEQNMMSFAGGMAREGLVPLVHTFAVFIYRRAYDQIAMSIAYPNLPVKMFGFLPGITSPGGATHQGIEDLAVMKALPNMTVLECGDATDVESSLDAAYEVDGPVYVRMLRGDIPRLFDRNDPMKAGRCRRLSEGDDIAVISSGICTEEAMKAVRFLKKSGLSVCHLHVYSHKPFDEDAAAGAAAGARYGVISVENHTTVGGLGTAVAEAMARRGTGKKLVKIGINDVFLHGAGREYLMKEYRMDAASVISAAGKLAGMDFRVEPGGLESSPVKARGDGTPSMPEDL